MQIRRLSTLLASLLSALSVLAATSPALAGPHEHGVATLDVVVDGTTLLVTLESPLDNLVGFEHAPRNDRQRAALARAEALLKDGGALFRSSPEAGCSLRSASVDMPFTHAAGVTADGHSEASASWEFGCTDAAALKQLDVRLFASFPALRTLRVQTATPRGQGSATLSAKRTVLAL